MLAFALDLASWLVGAAMLLAAFRLVRGPDLVDRVIALDTVYVNATALLVIYGVRLGVTDYYEPALIIAALGFLGTLAFAKFLLRGDVVE